MTGKNQRRQFWVSLMFLAPLLLTFGIFNLYPSLTGIYAAFTRWTLGENPVWVGLENLKTLLFDSSSLYYWQLRWGLQNTFVFVLLTVPFSIIVPLLLALALHSKCWGHRVFQAVYYLPSVLSLTVVMSSWNFMFNTNYGMINVLFGLGKLSWTNTVPFNWIALVSISVWWGCGGNMIIYQSALAGVPEEIIESSEIDGANLWQRFLHITLPSIRYPLTYTLATTTIAHFNVWGQPLMFNNGGLVVDTVNGYTRQANMMLMQYIRDLGFSGTGAHPGMASAMALVLGIIIVMVSLIQIRMMRENA